MFVEGQEQIPKSNGLGAINSTAKKSWADHMEEVHRIAKSHQPIAVQGSKIAAADQNEGTIKSPGNEEITLRRDTIDKDVASS